MGAVSQEELPLWGIFAENMFVMFDRTIENKL
jgi:hypothetical protein